MSGEKYLLDTNAVLYLLSGNSCMIPFLHTELSTSVISEMELLGYPKITENEYISIKKFLENCTSFTISEAIKNETISLRRKYNIKLPDAIIAATAIIESLHLISADVIFKQITELQFIFIKPSL